jgi:hypothetical protein
VDSSTSGDRADRVERSAIGNRVSRGVKDAACLRPPEERIAFAVIEQAVRELLDCEEKLRGVKKPYQRARLRKEQDDLLRWLSIPTWAHAISNTDPDYAVERSLRRLREVRRR